MKRKSKSKSEKRKIKNRKHELKKAFTLFYAVNAVITGLLLLVLGISVAGRNTERNISGKAEELFFLDDIKTAVSDFFKRELTELPLV